MFECCLNMLDGNDDITRSSWIRINTEKQNGYI